VAFYHLGRFQRAMKHRLERKRRKKRYFSNTIYSYWARTTFSLVSLFYLYTLHIYVEVHIASIIYSLYENLENRKIIVRVFIGPCIISW